MKIALVPVYVDYYENIVSGLKASKRELYRKAVTALELGGHEVARYDPVTDLQTAQAVRGRLSENSTDCLIVFPLVAAFSILSDELAKRWRGPLVLLSSMAGTAVPKTMTMTKAVAESQAFGSQAIANGWMRQGLKFQVVHHIPGTDHGDKAICGSLNTIEACRLLPRLRLGLIGQAFDGMTDVLLPKDNFTKHTGAKIIEIPMRRIHDFMNKATQADESALAKQLSQTFACGTFSLAERKLSLRAALAIQKVIAEEQLDCAAFNSHGPDGLKSQKLGVMCALGATLATSAGHPVAEVGDLCTAFAMWLGRKLGRASYYTELDSAYISSREWLLLNSGEYDLAWLRPRSKPRLLRNTNFKGVNGRGASVCAPLRPGPATLINFSPTPKGDKPYRIQYCEGTIGKKWNPEMGVGNARFEVVGDARTIYERWLSAGPVHHCCTSPGHLGKHLEFFCQEQDWNCLRIF
ncbi:MAG: hypothetical protein L0387_28990 [Acidobacteria bacterium]|nr:hypothetical protein [Acidobacteriota bacterium]